MATRKQWARISLNAGFAAMLIGAIDPMEGSLVILPGSGLVALGAYLGPGERSLKIYRLWVFGLITFGVVALFWLSMLGGIGPPERSMWWGVLILPYLIGWAMGILGADSPRWVLWLGLAVGCWYMAIPALMTFLPRQPPPDGANSFAVIQIVFGLIGALVLAGSIYRLRKTNA